MNLQRKEKGFTIIEVVLVLAIAGLIFLMVFIALPALQRNQRDTARKSDVASVASGVVAYTGNNRGSFPTSTTLASYVKDVSDNILSNSVPGDGIAVKPVPTATETTIAPADGVIWVTPGSECGVSSVDGQIITKGTTRQFTVVLKLESGGGAYFCQNS